ncbi:hypothetical protein VPH35_098183 [Triticum aestivum]|uniref:Uncharacterized protein n=1 Tax=Aegilops tauschii subsp. strangulata TaxID=200361 RepID=A0A453L171_AEGTS
MAARRVVTDSHPPRDANVPGPVRAPFVHGGPPPRERPPTATRAYVRGGARARSPPSSPVPSDRALALSLLFSYVVAVVVPPSNLMHAPPVQERNKEIMWRSERGSHDAKPFGGYRIGPSRLEIPWAAGASPCQSSAFWKIW